MTAYGRAEALQRLKAAALVFLPTLVVGEFSRFVADSLAALRVNDTLGRLDPRRRYVSGHLVEDWREQVAERRDGPPIDWTKVAPGLMVLPQEVHRAGLRMMPGTDVAVALLIPGYSLHAELEQMVRHLGLTPMEAFVSATRYPTEFFGMEDSLGTITAGKIAGLVLLGADPTVDIRHTECIEAVMKGGRLLRRSQLDAALAQIDPRRSGDATP